MTVFDWEELRPKLQKQATRDATIEAAFQQWIDGSDCYDDMSSCELQGLFDLFRASWIICEHTIGDYCHES